MAGSSMLLHFSISFSQVKADNVSVTLCPADTLAGAAGFPPLLGSPSWPWAAPIAQPGILLATGKCLGPGLAYWLLAGENYGAYVPLQLQANAFSQGLPASSGFSRMVWI